jgi:hypothetical protein
MTVVARSAARTRRWRRGHVLVAIVVLAMLAEAAIAASLLKQPSSPSRAPRPALSPTRDGAIRMAVKALYSLSIPAIADRARFETAIVELAAPGFDREVAADFGDAGAELAVSFRRAPHVLRAAPLGYRVVRYTPRAASVAIWSVAIAASRDFAPDAQWRTVVIDVAWTRGGWRVTGGSGTAGPDPSTRLRELAVESSRFRTLTYAP